MRTVRVVALLAAALGAFAPAALAQAKPEKLRIKRFRLRHCDLADAKQAFEGLADLAAPIKIFPPQPPAPVAVSAAATDPDAPVPAPVFLVAMGGPQPPPPPATPPASDTAAPAPAPVTAPARSSFRAVLDLRSKSLVVRGSEQDLRFAADLVAVLDTPEDRPLPVVQRVRAFRVKHVDAEEMIQQLRELDPEGKYRVVPVGRIKLVVATGSEEALEELASGLKELDVSPK